MKISGYGIKNNKYTSNINFKQLFPKTPAQQKFIDLMKSDEGMYKNWKSVCYYDLENVPEDMTPNGLPIRAFVSNVLNSDFTKCARYAIENFLKAFEGLHTFKYKALEKIYNNSTIMENGDTRANLIGLLGKWSFNAKGEYSPEQEEIMNKLLDNERLYGSKKYFRDASSCYSTSGLFGEVFYPKVGAEKITQAQLERPKMVNDVLQTIIDNKDLNDFQIAEILKIMTNDKYEDNREIKLAKVLAEENILPKDDSQYYSDVSTGRRSYWGNLRFFVKQSGGWYRYEDLLKNFQNDERAKRSPRFLELLNQINQEFMPEQVKEQRKRK